MIIKTIEYYTCPVTRTYRQKRRVFRLPSGVKLLLKELGLSPALTVPSTTLFSDLYPLILRANEELRNPHYRQFTGYNDVVEVISSLISGKLQSVSKEAEIVVED